MGPPAHLFNTSRFVSSFKGSSSALLAAPCAFSGGRTATTRRNPLQLPLSRISQAALAIRRTSIRHLVGERRDLERFAPPNLTNGCLVQKWRPIIHVACAERARSSNFAVDIGGTTKSINSEISNTVVFSAGQSLCWNAYKSRHATECVRRYPMCGQVLRALGWSRLIARLQQRVLNGVEAARAAALNNETYPVSRQYAQAAADHKVPWAAVHVRAFVCEQNRREPSFAHVAAALAKLGIRSGFVYVVSSVPVEQVQRALPAYTVVAKSTFLGSDVRNKFPFEALAAIDYGVAVQAPLYLGEPQASSFDAFADEERRQRGLMVDQIASTCEV